MSIFRGDVVMACPEGAAKRKTEKQKRRPHATGEPIGGDAIVLSMRSRPWRRIDVFGRSPLTFRSVYSQ
jgi:hypothetical protein